MPSTVLPTAVATALEVVDAGLPPVVPLPAPAAPDAAAEADVAPRPDAAGEPPLSATPA